MSEDTLPTPDLKRLQIARAAAPDRRRGGFAKYVWLFVLGAGIFGAWHYRDSWMPARDTEPSGAREGAVREVDTSAAVVTASANGYVIARKKAALSTVISGLLVELKVEEGSVVKAGDVVARLQYDDFETAVREADAGVLTAAAEVRSAEAMLAMAEAQRKESDSALGVAQSAEAEAKVEAENARREMERQKAYMAQSGDMSESDWDRVKTAAAVADARLLTATARVLSARSAVETAEAVKSQRAAEIARLETMKIRAAAAAESARILLRKTLVTAPFDGVIIRKDAEEGEVVASTGFGANSRGSVATIVDMATLEVQVELSEELLGSIRSDSEALVTLDTEPERRYAGRVRQVWPTADRQKGTIELRVVFTERPEVLRPEMGVRVDFPEAAASRPIGERILVVAASAVRGEGAERYVFTIEGDRVKRRPVSVGAKRGADLVVRDGLQRGARVVVDAPETMRDGDLWTSGSKEKK